MSYWDHPSPIDKAAEKRVDPEWVAAQWCEPSAQVLMVDSSGRVEHTEGGILTRSTEGDFDPLRHTLLGLLDGVPLFSMAGESEAMMPLRGLIDSLGPQDLAVAFVAVATETWHRSARHCGWCGGFHRPVNGGQVRRCAECGRETYPRLDPAVIVAIIDDADRLLLGRQSTWAPGRVSVFAGFVEVGESLEQAVHRELLEETGLEVEDLALIGSQPWPFPRSLMVGFSARATSTDFQVDLIEIERAAWFTRDGLRRALAEGRVALPSPASIARRMIDAWLDHRLPARPA